MTYATLETSTQDGAPVELYQFTAGPISYLWTSADTPVTVGALTYTPIYIERGAIQAGNELNRFTLPVQVAGDNALALAFIAAPPMTVVLAEVFRLHRGDTDVKTIFTGRLAGVGWKGARAELTLEPNYSAIRRQGLRRRYGRGCPHPLFGHECGEPRAAHAVSDVVISVTGNVIETGLASAQADDYFAGGYVEIDSQLGQAMIIAHAGANLTLAQRLPQLTAGTAITYYPGCAHTLAVCNSKYANADNYGGMPRFPTQNPFTTAIY